MTRENRFKKFLLSLAEQPGVYQMLDAAGKVIYVGKAKNLKNRVSSYFSSSSKDPKTVLLVKNIADIQITVTHTETEAVLLECNLIKQHSPRFNVLLRDDKSYPYIHITGHKYPRILMYRGKLKKTGLFFGPYPNSLAVRETISLLQKIFQLRTCTDSFFKNRSRPCLLYQIGRCSGPCVNYINDASYAENVKMACLFLSGKSKEVLKSLTMRMQQASKEKNFELAAQYRDQIQRLKEIQEKQYVSGQGGDADVIAAQINAGVAAVHVLTIRHGQVVASKTYFPKAPDFISENELLSAFIKQHYLADGVCHAIPKELILSKAIPDSVILEEVMSQKSKVHFHCPQRGERKKWLFIAEASLKQSLASHLYDKINMQERFLALQAVLELSSLPKRLECFDVSHIQGEATVASCVVFDSNGPLKSDYRRYNIADVTPGDDVAAIYQAVSRRFKRIQANDAVIPDLLIIDGGKAQLAAARKALHELGDVTIELMSVSKGAGRKAGYESLHRIDMAPIHLPHDSLALHLIQHIRDEAHRFAITGHRMRRDKARVKSALEEIAGIGPKKRRSLLRYFGGIKGVARANLDELLRVPGINQSLAEKIVAAFHEENN